MTQGEDRNLSAEEMPPANFILLGSFPNSRLMAERHPGSRGDEVAAMQVMAVVNFHVGDNKKALRCEGFHANLLTMGFYVVIDLHFISRL